LRVEHVNIDLVKNFTVQTGHITVVPIIRIPWGLITLCKQVT